MRKSSLLLLVITEGQFLYYSYMIIAHEDLRDTCLSSKDIVVSDSILSNLSAEKRAVVERRKATLDFLACRYIISTGSISAGFIIAPKQSTKRKHPVIVYLRGGTGDFGIVNAGTMYLQLAALAELGYLVIGTQYTGNALGTGTDTWGGEDLEATMYVQRIIQSLPRVDAQAVTMIGGSRGATMMYMALKGGFQARAAISIAGVSDLAKWVVSRPDMREIFCEMFGTSIDEELAARSAVNWVEELPKSVRYILIHGAEDETVPARQSQELHKRMDRAGLHVDLRIVSGKDHHITVDSQEIVDIISRSNLIDMTNNVEDLLEFHPDFLEKVSLDDRELLAKFFFAGREVDVEDVAKYQADLESSDPGVTERARQAYARLMSAAGSS